MNLLARNWMQVKNSKQIFAIGNIKEKQVNGGTGYGVQMGIDNFKEVFVYDQNIKCWFIWSYILNNFKKVDKSEVLIKYNNFAGIGTRKINEYGKKAIELVFENTKKK